MSNFFHIRCTIERGGFTSERTFEIPLKDGGILVGTANIEHLCGADKMPLSDDEPPFGVKLDGFVRCRKIRDDENGVAVVEVPSADLIRVPAEELIEMQHC